jgi:phosphoglycolate phosphatase-like HAD superfamily hydrolase
MNPVLAFDLDGTLLACRERQVAVAHHVAGPIDEDLFWTAKRAGACTAAALTAVGVADGPAVAAEWVAQIEDERWLALDQPTPSAAAALRLAAAAGRSPFVLTARRDRDGVLRQLERTGLAELVAGVEVVDPSRAAERKAAVLRELAATGLVGDTESDARAAKLAGVPFAGVGTGQRSRSFLRASGIEPVHAGALDAVGALLAYARRATA